MCRPVVKRVHVIIVFFKGPYWLFFRPCMFVRPQMPLGYVSVSYNIVFVYQAVSSYQAFHSCVVDRACWPCFLVDRASFSLCSLTALPCWPCFHFVILTVLASHERRLSVHSIKLVQFHWPLCSLYHFICPRDLRPWCIASVSMSEKCNSMYPFLWKCPRILIILDIVHIWTCFNES